PHYSLLSISSSDCSFSCYCVLALSRLHSFPTRRSSDLLFRAVGTAAIWNDRRHRILMKNIRSIAAEAAACPGNESSRIDLRDPLDRKSTRLNSSHQIISYAVFCLKKKSNRIQ